jgi:hypothetical protein
MGSRAVLNRKQKSKISAVELKLDRETTNDRYWRRMKEEYEPLKGRLTKQLRRMKEEIDDELEAAQKVCKHIDDGGMFYGSCKKCGLIGD